MVNKSLLEWYKQQLDSGLPQEQLLPLMEKAGYTKKEIREVLASFHQPPRIDDMAHVESIKHWERKPTAPVPKKEHAKEGKEIKVDHHHPPDHFEKPRRKPEKAPPPYKQVRRHAQPMPLNQLVMKEFNVLWAMVLIGITFILFILAVLIFLLLTGPGLF